MNKNRLPFVGYRSQFAPVPWKEFAIRSIKEYSLRIDFRSTTTIR